MRRSCRTVITCGMFKWKDGVLNLKSFHLGEIQEIVRPAGSECRWKDGWTDANGSKMGGMGEQGGLDRERGEVLGCGLDWWQAAERQRVGVGGAGVGKGEVWERRRLSCLFEDKSERQRSEEVCICKHTHTNRCVCVRAHASTRTPTHMQTHTNTLTISPRTLSAQRRGGKRPRLIGCCRLISPRVAEQCMWDVWIQTQSSVKR